VKPRSCQKNATFPKNIKKTSKNIKKRHLSEKHQFQETAKSGRGSFLFTNFITTGNFLISIFSKKNFASYLKKQSFVLLKFCFSKLCSSKLCSSKLCSSKLCSSKLCSSKLCSSKLCSCKLCFSKLCSGKTLF
jgi:hypothetical protein